MPYDGSSVEIVHARAMEGAISRRKTGGLDNVDLYTDACSQAQNGPGVLRNIGLEKRKPDWQSSTPWEDGSIALAGEKSDPQALSSRPAHATPPHLHSSGKGAN